MYLMEFISGVIWLVVIAVLLVVVIKYLGP